MTIHPFNETDFAGVLIIRRHSYFVNRKFDGNSGGNPGEM